MNKRSLIAAALAAVIILGLAVWSMNYNTQNRETNPPEPTQSAEPQTDAEQTTLPEDSAEPQVIVYDDDGFTQQSYSMKAGETLTVRNDSSRTLEFSSDEHPTHRDNAELNLAPIKPGARATLTVTKTGTWGIHDHLREEYTTTVVVTE